MLKIITAASILCLLVACGPSEVEIAPPVTVEKSVVEAPVKVEVVADQAAVDVAPVTVEAEAVVPSADTSAEKYIEGQHYTVLSRPIPTSDPSKVEVAEFFWYGCSHCYHFEPLIQQYKKSLPDSIQVVPVPAMWRDVMILHAKAFYAAQILDLPDLHEALFKALNVDRNPLANESQIVDLFEKYGVDRDKAEKVLGSFGVSSQVNKARSLAAGAKISGTPSIVVNGKYLVETRLAGSQANMLKIADYLAKKEAAM